MPLDGAIFVEGMGLQKVLVFAPEADQHAQEAGQRLFRNVSLRLGTRLEIWSFTL